MARIEPPSVTQLNGPWQSGAAVVEQRAASQLAEELHACAGKPSMDVAAEEEALIVVIRGEADSCCSRRRGLHCCRALHPTLASRARTMHCGPSPSRRCRQPVHPVASGPVSIMMLELRCRSTISHRAMPSRKPSAAISPSRKPSGTAALQQSRCHDRSHPAAATDLGHQTTKPSTTGLLLHTTLCPYSYVSMGRE